VKPIRTILYFEAALNSLAALVALFSPGWLILVLSGMTGEALTRAFVQLYAMLLIPLIYVMLRALRNGSLEALKPVLQAYLIGDVLHLGGAALIGNAAEQWTPGLILLAVLTALAGAVRVYALVRPELVAALHPAAAKSRQP
jgi:hypothetical protein